MNVATLIVAVVAALLGGGGLAGYLGVRRQATATVTVAATSKPHEQLSVETVAFREFMEQARVERTELLERLAACEEKHAEADTERRRLEALVAELHARIAHLERRLGGPS